MMKYKKDDSEGPWMGIFLGILTFFGGVLSISGGPPYTGKGGLPMPEATAWIMMLFGLLMTFASIRRLLRERRKSRSRQAAPPAEPDEDATPENGDPPDKP